MCVCSQCEDMYDDMYALTDDYMANKYNVNAMCQRGKYCKGSKKGLARRI